MSQELLPCPICQGSTATDRYGPTDAKPEMAINCEGKCDSIFILPDVAPGDYDGLRAAWNNLALRSSRSPASTIAEVDGLRTALEPFARIAQAVEHTDKRDGDVVHRQILDGKRMELTKDDFRRASRALAASSTSGLTDGGDEWHDIVTHRRAWRDAIILARDEASEGSEDPEADRSYWNHELRAFDRTFAKLAALAQPDAITSGLTGDRAKIARALYDVSHANLVAWEDREEDHPWKVGAYQHADAVISALAQPDAVTSGMTDGGALRARAIAIVQAEAEDMGYCPEDVANMAKLDGDDGLAVQAVERALAQPDAVSGGIPDRGGEA